MFFGFMFFLMIVILIIVITYRTYYGNRAYRFGYPSRQSYLKAVPRSDDEKRDAVDQVCKGAVICLLGLLSSHGPIRGQYCSLFGRLFAGILFLEQCIREARQSF